MAALIDEYIEMYRSQDENDQLPKQIAQQQKQRDIAQRKKRKLLEYNVTGQLSDADFLFMSKACTEEIMDSTKPITFQPNIKKCFSPNRRKATSAPFHYSLLLITCQKSTKGF